MVTFRVIEAGGGSGGSAGRQERAAIGKNKEREKFKEKGHSFILFILK